VANGKISEAVSGAGAGLGAREAYKENGTGCAVVRGFMVVLEGVGRVSEAQRGHLSSL